MFALLSCWGGLLILGISRGEGGQLIKLSKPTKVKDCECHVVYLTRKLRGWGLYRGSLLIDFPKSDA